MVCPCFSQNCDLSNDQQIIVSQASEAIRAANNNPSYETYIDLVTKCKKALDEISNCPDIYYFYENVIDTYHILAIGTDENGERSENELYFYEEAINYCNRYLQVLPDSPKKDSYTQFLEKIKTEYSIREQAVAKEKNIESDNEAWDSVLKFPNKKYYQEYVDAHPYGIHAGEANEAIAKIDAEEEFRDKIQYPNDISVWEMYLNKYPKINEYHFSDDIQVKLDSIKEEVLYENIKTQNQNQDEESYIRLFPNGKYINDVKDRLCSYYFQKTKSLYESDKNEAEKYYQLLSNLNCSQKREANNYINYIERENKLKLWNEGYKDKNYYSYISDASSLSGYNNFSQGISFFTLHNQKWGFYFSYKASNPFYSVKKSLDNFPNDKYTLVEKPQKSVSSVSLSLGTTKKIFRPVFGYLGLGLGTNSILTNYSVTNLSDNTTNLAKISNDSVSWYLSPEVGIIVDLWGVSLLAGLRYSIPLNNINEYNYNGLSYTFGIGFGINSSKDVYKKNWRYFAYNFDLGYPNINFSFNDEECISNKGLIGISFGSLNTSGVGFYTSYRSNVFLYNNKDNSTDYISNENLIDGNLKRNSKAFLTLGITKKIQYPFWFYVGGGVSYYSESNKFTISPNETATGDNEGNLLSNETTAWIKDPNSVKWGFNPEIGIAINLWGLILRGGINQPIPFNGSLSPQFSFSIGGAWERN